MDFFENIDNLDTFFDENIKYIDLHRNNLTQRDVEVLYDELVKYSKFTHLHVDQDLRPYPDDPLALWDSRIG